MEILAKSAEQAFHQVLNILSKDGMETNPRGMKIKEVINCCITITNPRDRIINCPEREFNAAFAFGELLWYLSGRNDLEMMEYYSKFMRKGTDDGETLNSAYGYRIFSGKHPKIGFDQWENVKSRLKKDLDSRQAIIHLHTPNNQKTNDEVCTLSLQFLLRNNKLDLIVTMRSNDIVLGFTYDVFSFTMLQEILANELGVELGTYYHNVGSMHIYENKFHLLKKHTISYLPAMEPFRHHKKDFSRLETYEMILRLTESYDDLYMTVLENMNDNLSKFVYSSLFLKSLNTLGLSKTELLTYQNKVINIVRKSNENYADILQYLGKFGRANQKIIIEGSDGTGKSTLVNEIVKSNPDDGYQIQHYCKPSPNFGYDPNYFHSLKTDYNVIFDRSFISEYVYGNVIRGESFLDYCSIDRLFELTIDQGVEFIFLIPKDEEQKQIVLNRMSEEDKKNIAPYFDELIERYKSVACYLKHLGANVDIREVI